MVICCHCPGGLQRPSDGPAIMTVPSAGDTTSPSPVGMVRSGSRKK
jgi:hypothetical protein